MYAHLFTYEYTHIRVMFMDNIRHLIMYMYICIYVCIYIYIYMYMDTIRHLICTMPHIWGGYS